MKRQAQKIPALLLALALLLSAAGCAGSPPAEESGSDRSIRAEDEAAEHTHAWRDGVCEVCGAKCAHVWEDGVCTVCGLNCVHVWEDGACTVCGLNCAHVWEDGVCTVCGLNCPHDRHDAETGVCPVCGLKVGHRYVNSVCSRCGAVPQVVLIPNDYPGEVLGEIPQEHGTLETWHYFPLTGEVESGGRVVKSREDKKIREIVVYTPPGYDPAERYDLLLIAPGAGHTAHQWLEKTNRVNGLYPRITGRDLLDSMIAHGYTEPLIVAVVEYYLHGAAENVAPVYEQDLRERVLPFLAREYATFATADDDGVFHPAPEHFAFIGVSFGSMMGWEMLPECTDLFSYWGLYSGGFQDNAGLLWRLGQGVDETRPIHYLYAGDGTMLESWHAYYNRFEALLQGADALEEGRNALFYPIKKTEHNYADWNISLFNSLQLFFKNRYEPGADAAFTAPEETAADAAQP